VLHVGLRTLALMRIDGSGSLLEVDSERMKVAVHGHILGFPHVPVPLDVHSKVRMYYDSMSGHDGVAGWGTLFPSFPTWPSEICMQYT
jgi:hypothetical protein